MNPKFSIGENCLVKVNENTFKDCVVLDIEKVLDGFNLATGERYPGITFRYTIDLTKYPMGEIALRKKHQPSNLSFNQLMNVLNSPIASKDGVK